MADDAIQKLVADEKELTRQGVVLDFVKAKVDNLDKKFDALVLKIDDKYVTHEEYDLFKGAVSDGIKELATKEELEPVKENVKGLIANQRLVVSAIILAVIGGVLSLIFIK